ncbi:MAG: Ig-like domain repeat protein [Planctomycetes bacterium]|nr:Ig-like domain repeat protein [Planctomycetota bacterium]
MAWSTSWLRNRVRRPIRRKPYRPRFDTLEDRTVPAPIPSTFAGNAQHTGIYDAVAQDLNQVHWFQSVDMNVAVPANYGTPLVSAGNTVFVPVKISPTGTNTSPPPNSNFIIKAFDGNSGALKYTLTPDYIEPSYSTMPSYSPAIATGPTGTRLYYAGAGGTIWYIDNADSAAHTAPVQLVFYTTFANYLANAGGPSGFNATVFINTPLTTDSAGDLFFGFRVQGTPPLGGPPANQSGFARIGVTGPSTFVATYVMAGAASGDALISRDAQDSAPALSNDQTTLYVAVKATSTDYYGYLVGLDSTTLLTKYKTATTLRDPRNTNNPVGIIDGSTASVVVAPNYADGTQGDVYFGVAANPDNDGRGFLLHYTADLATKKTPGGFGTNSTPSIVPKSMVPAYTGTSPYLIFTKYNNYPDIFSDGNGGDGVNRLAILDPNIDPNNPTSITANSTQVDPHPLSNGVLEMREVITAIAPSADPQYVSVFFPKAVVEWNMNTAAVNPLTNSIFAVSEDGQVYRWNTFTNTLDQVEQLDVGFPNVPDVPTVIGPDGQIYAVSGGIVYALGTQDYPAPVINRVTVKVTSSSADLRSDFFPTTVTFTAQVTNIGISGTLPTGSVTFTLQTSHIDFVTGLYVSDPPINLGTASVNPATGLATLTVAGSVLPADQHDATVPTGETTQDSIKAHYNGDGTFSQATVTMVQKVHRFASTTTVTSSPNPATANQLVTFTATVAGVSSGTLKPTGMVTFRENTTVLGQKAANSLGVATFSILGSTLGSGTHTITADYASDIFFAASSGDDSGNPQVITSNQTTSTTVSLSGPNPSIVNNAVTFTAFIQTTGVAGTPTGSVTFQEGAAVLAANVPVDATGHATFTTSALDIGSHVITANFTGTGGWQNSTGNSPTQVVQIVSGSGSGAAVKTFGGNSQHTSVYTPVAQDLNSIHWQTSIDINPSAAAHYGAPLVSPSNTVFVPVKISATGFRIDVFNGVNGAFKYSLSSDYILPSFGWVPVYQPVLVTGATTARLYYPGAGGSIWYIDNADNINHGAPVRVAFYGAYSATLNGSVFVDTPITGDAAGNIFFGFRTQGTAGAPLNTTQSGFARIDPSNAGSYVLAGTAAGDAGIGRDSHNSAPAISNDGTTVYVLAKAPGSDFYGYLLGLDTTTLATKYKVLLKDPRNNNQNFAGILDDSTASPMVAPDGDVYIGVFASTYLGSRGWLLRFSGDLATEKTPGAFGWDSTPAIVPASMVPSYTGASTYLIFSKYNNYDIDDGDGVNKVALLDPNSTQLDPHPQSAGQVEMREIFTIIGPTPDAAGPSYPNAVREWCINTAAVDPATNSIFFDSEDGRIYRWNMLTNSLSQAIALTPGIGEPYVPSVIGPDGTVYTLNGGTLFALGNANFPQGAANSVDVKVNSSAPDHRTVVVGASLTFTANVSNVGTSLLKPTGSVTFTDLTYVGLTPVTTTLATGVPLDASGNASFTTSTLGAGQHFITATYNGDSNFTTGSVTLVQKIHANASTTAVTATPNPVGFGQSVTITAIVTSVPPGAGTPSGMVTFKEGSQILAQQALISGTTSFSTSALGVGNHIITAVYYSDFQFATSTGSTSITPILVQDGTTTTVTSTPNPSTFGQTVTFTATVSAVDVTAGVPAGTVTFTEGAVTLASNVAVDATGHASFSTSTFTVGNHTITATFNPSTGWLTSTGNDSGTPQLVQDGTTTVVASTPNPSTFGQLVTFTATVTAVDVGAGVPAGTVTFREGVTVLAASVAVDATGHAAFSTTGLAIGSHTITATFTGNAGWLTSTGSSPVQTVTGGAAVVTFACNAQHTGVYSTPAQPLNAIHWQASIDTNPGAFAHYGTALVTSSNTVMVPQKIAGNAFQVNAFNGATGAVLYTLSTDYILPTFTWIPTYSGAIATGAFGTRYYYAGAGGTIFYIDNPDSASHGAPVRYAFYGIANYNANVAGFNGTVFIDTPLTVDNAGNVFFGFRVQGTAPAPLNTTQSGFARIAPDGTATYVLAGTISGDATIAFDSHDAAPALSNDGTTLYVVVKSGNANSTYAYLLGLDSTTLALKYKTPTTLRDPRSNNLNGASVRDLSTASPMVAPDGSVFFGILGNPSNGSRGWLLHYSGDLQTEFTPGGFGWDYTPAIVPASMVPSYTGTSSYLIFAKYNNYDIGDGNGVNRVALLDPNATQIDPHTSAGGQVEMREVFTVISPTPDNAGPSFPNASREWCINASAVNPATDSIYFPNEDGRIYRWDLGSNSLHQGVALNSGVGQPYVPTIIGPDGTIFTLNGGNVFALGEVNFPLGGANAVGVALDSSSPNMNTVVAGDTLTFTATITNRGSSGLSPTGTVTFTDLTYVAFVPTTTTLAANVPLVGGQATFTTSALSGVQHFITATYNGDANFTTGTSMLVQNVHANASSTVLTVSANPGAFATPVTFTATVTSVPPGAGTPTGMVTFLEGTQIVWQSAVNGSGVATFTTSTLSLGNHSFSAVYASDFKFARSTSNTVSELIQDGTSTTVTSTPNPSSFGQLVTFTATVTAADVAAGIPSGTVTFTEGAVTLAANVAVDATGHATFTTSTLVVGSHTITATFNPNVGWVTSNGSDSGNPQLVQSATATALTSTPNPSAFNQTVTFTATVTSVGAGVPAGTVTFTEGAATLASNVAVDATGHATFTISTLTAGSHVVTASFTGATGWLNSSGNDSGNPQVVQDGTTTTVTSSPNPSSFNQTVTFTATIGPVDAGAGVPAGTVTFTEGATVLAANVAVDATGHATFNTATLGLGNHTITATFTGATGWGNSSGNDSGTPQLVQDGTTTTVASTPNPSTFGQLVTFTATVTAVIGGAGVPSGTVTFTEGATLLAANVAVDATGHASFSTFVLGIGSHTITATFTPNTGWLASSGSSAPAQVVTGGAPVVTLGGNAQHTGVFNAPAQNLNAIHWQTQVDLNPQFSGGDLLIHYGVPLVTAGNTVIVPVKTGALDGWQIEAFNGTDGSLKYTLSTDYTLPSHNWTPTFSPVLVGTRLYYGGIGGTVYYVDNIDTNTPTAPVQLAFYGAHTAAFDTTVFIDTPITADSNGDIFFGFRVQGTAPAPISSTRSGYARIDSSGNGSYVLVNTAASDGTMFLDSHNAGPAISNDGTTVYVLAKTNNVNGTGYLLGLDTTTLATKYKRALLDPRSGSGALLLDDSTASPMVAPDGDVFIGVFGNPANNGSRGFLLHFSGDLSATKTPGGFGWDQTPAIVPAFMVPSYTGSSSYLIMSKYNNYYIGDGDGVNKIALLDPNATQVDPHPTAGGLIEMREVFTIIGPTPDDEQQSPTFPNAVREWCINTAAVNPATNSVFVPSEDGRIYRWNLATNSLSQTEVLTGGIGEAYVPTVIGPDGTVYTLNGAMLYALGNVNFPSGGANSLAVTMTSSSPDVRYALTGDSITFSANLANIGISGNIPAGTVTFTDTVYFVVSPGVLGSNTVTLATVPVDALGNASVTTSALTADQHFITATYSGDANFSTGTVTLVQKVHANATTNVLTSSANPGTFGQNVTFTATVTSVPPGAGTPSGMVTFLDGTQVIGQRALNGSGVATFTISALGVGNHAITAVYYSDIQFAASTSNLLTELIQDGTTTSVTSTPNPSSFGQLVTFTATVSSVDVSAGMPSGTVTFTEGAITLAANVAVDATGHASFSTSALTGGSHTITATFTPNTGWVASSGNDSGNPQIVQDGTTTTINSTPNPSTFNQAVTFTATVSAVDAGAGVPAGTVTFTEGAVTLASNVAVDATGHASFTISTLGVGSHIVTATFTGNNGWGNSNGNDSANPQLVQDGTSTTVSSTPNPSAFNQTVTFTATVTAADVGAGVPTGTVTFKEGAVTLASNVAVDGTGHATFTISTLSVGNHTITATFTGTTGWSSSSGDDSASQQLVQDGTTATVTSTPNPSIVGQSVTFTATITAADAGAGVPAGTVTFTEGAVTLAANVAVDATGHASFSTSTLTIGSHTITATFTGATGWLGSFGDDSANPQVVQNGTITTVSSTPNPSTFNQTVTFTATITSGSGTPTGSVTFTEGAVTLASNVAVDATGHATFTIATLSVGSHTINAAFTGTGGFLDSTGNDSSSPQIVQDGTTTTVTSTPNSSTFGQLVTFTATVTAADVGAGIPTGTVTFTEGALTLASNVAVDATGHATFTISSLSVGNHTITATFTGTTGWLTSAGDDSSSPQLVQDGTTTTVTSTPNPSIVGQSVTFTATITAADVGAGVPAGTVTFTEGAVTLAANVAVDATGHATFSTTALAFGSHTITATFTGATGWLGSFGDDSANPQVVTNGTVTTVNSTPNPSAFNQTVTFTATITSGSGTPTGSVTFTEGAVTLASNVAVDATGHATFTISTLSVGSHTITAAFTGTGGFIDSTGNDSASPQIVQDGTATTVTSTPNPSIVGQSVTFTATVTAADVGAGVPAGTVTFTEGAVTLAANVAVDATGHAAFSTATLAGGSHTITATFTGTTGWLTSTGDDSANPQVVQNGTTTSVTSTPNPSNFNQTVTFTATITSGSGGTPTGNVTFTEGAVTLASNVVVDATGHASFTIATLPVGSHTITAAFTGTGGWLNSSGNDSASPQIVRDGTTTTLTSSPNPASFGLSVTFTATVAAVDAGAGVPAGTVTFKEGAVTLAANVAVDATGHASFTTSTLTAGSHIVTATFTGNTGWLTSTGSDSASPQVVQDGTTTVVTSSPNPSSFGQSVTFTATITAVDAGAGIPAGTVTFTEGAVTLASNVAVNASGLATFNTTTLAVGTHTITATFTGSVGWLGSSGNDSASPQLVQNNTTTVGASTPNPAGFGQLVTFTATVSSSGGGTPTGNVTFTEGATTLAANVPVNAAGRATFSIATLGVGSHVITASFTGTNGWGNSSGNFAAEVIQDGTTTTLQSTPNPTIVGQSVAFTSTVTAVDAGAGVPTGTVTFRDGAITLAANVPLDATGRATISTTALAAGTHIITATFTGTTGWLTSTGAVSQVVNAAPTTRSWTGAGANDNWSNPANWAEGFVPVTGNDLFFGTGASRLANVNDLAAGTSFHSITFSASGYSISGNGIALTTGGLHNAAGSNIVNLPITLNAAGTIQAAASTSLEFDAPVIKGNFTLTIDSGNLATINFANAISGLGALVKINSGTLIYSGSAANTYTGTTTVNAGLLQLGKTAGVNAIAGNLIIGDGSLPLDLVRLTASDQIADTATVTLQSSGQLDLNNNNDTVGPLTILSASIVTGTGTLTLGGNVTASGASSISGFLDTGALTRAISVTGGGTLTVNGVLGGVSGFTKTGGGTLSLPNANTYSGASTLSTGTLLVGNDNALGSGTLNLNGGTFQANGTPPRSIANNVTLGGNVTIAGTLATTFTGPVSLTGDRRITTTNTALTTFSGVITEIGGSWGITKAGSATLVLSGNNVFSGLSSLIAGTLAIASDTALGTSTLDLVSGTIRADSGPRSLANSFLIDGNVTLGGSLPLTFTGPGTLLADHTLNVSNTALTTISGAIGESGGAWTLTKSGAGVLALNAANTFSGGFILNAGTLIAGDNGAFGTGPVTFRNATVQAGGSARTFANSVVFGGNTTFAGALGMDFAGPGTLTGTRTLTVTNTALTTFSGVIGDLGAGFGLTKASTGTLLLSGLNTYSGITTLSAGALALGSNSAVGTGTLTLNAGTLLASGAARTLNNPYNLGNITFGGTLDLTLAGNTGLTGTRTLTITNTANTTLSGVISEIVVLRGITKAGPGNLIFSGNNTYTGITRINAGNMRIDGAQPASNVTVAAGGTLTGSGTVGNLTVLSGGTLSPGDTGAGAILSCKNFTMNAGSIFQVDLNGLAAGAGGYDRVDATGTVSVSNSTLNLSVGFTPTIGSSFTIVTNDLADPVTGTFTGLLQGATINIGGMLFQISYTGGTGNDIVLTRIA